VPKPRQKSALPSDQSGKLAVVDPLDEEDAGNVPLNGHFRFEGHERELPLDETLAPGAAVVDEDTQTQQHAEVPARDRRSHTGWLRRRDRRPAVKDEQRQPAENEASEAQLSEQPPAAVEDVRNAKKTKRRRRPLAWLLSQFKRNPRTATPAPKPEEAARPKRARYGRTARFTQTVLLLLMCVWTLGSVRGCSASHLFHQEQKARKFSDSAIDGQLKQLGASSTFPLADATAKAERLAYECFTVPNYGGDASNVDQVAVQNKALANAGIPAGAKVNCGWNGQGRGKVDSMQVVNDPYWIHNDHATIVLQVKLYQRPGFFYYYVPFKNRNGVPQFAGMPAIFGTASGALDFLHSCSGLQEVNNADQLRHTAQLFLDSLSGNTDIDLGYLVYGTNGATKFGGFGPTVSAPRVSQVLYCGTRGQEKLFEAMVRFNGPVDGSRYSLPYGFGVVPNPETSGRFQIKDFGPAPNYSLG
jgi:hypothetical protein